MMKVRNLGKKSFDEVTAKLRSLGLDFCKERRRIIETAIHRRR